MSSKPLFGCPKEPGARFIGNFDDTYGMQSYYISSNGKIIFRCGGSAEQGSLGSTVAATALVFAYKQAYEAVKELLVLI